MREIQPDLFDRMLAGVAEPACAGISRGTRAQAVAVAAAVLLVPAARASAQDTCVAPCGPTPVEAEDLAQTESPAPSPSVAAPQRETAALEPRFDVAPAGDGEAGGSIALADPTLSASLPPAEPDGAAGSAALPPPPVEQSEPVALSTTEPAPDQALAVDQDLRGGVNDVSDDAELADWDDGGSHADDGACHHDDDAPLGGTIRAVDREGGSVTIVGNGSSTGDAGRDGGRSITVTDKHGRGADTAELRRWEMQMLERVMEMIADSGWSYEVADDGSMRNLARA
ncbi:MAG: hypothetical protein ACRD0K_02940 [Egibacteraceae bacterium]